jgi:hypothetical protein
MSRAEKRVLAEGLDRYVEILAEIAEEYEGE